MPDVNTKKKLSEKLVRSQLADKMVFISLKKKRKLREKSIIIL